MEASIGQKDLWLDGKVRSEYHIVSNMTPVESVEPASPRLHHEDLESLGFLVEALSFQLPAKLESSCPPLTPLQRRKARL